MKLSIPIPLRIGALVIGTTLFYTFIGQRVPQKVVLPPVETLISAEMTTEELVVIGRDIAEDKGICLTCHTIGQSGSLRFPDLEGIAQRAESRIEGLTGADQMKLRRGSTLTSHASERHGPRSPVHSGYPTSLTSGQPCRPHWVGLAASH